MAYDELELDRIGDRKTAVFFIISDTTQTYNFLVALAFSQMFNLLCERADNVHGGRLPHHVRVLWDEAANTGQVPQLEKIVAVIRSREISLTLFYQQLAQCKAIYDKHAETILGNMDSVIFLGGREASTIKEISENWLGKATISMQTDSRSRGQAESYSQNNQRLGRELMTPSELATMPGDKCILQLRGLPPFYSPKYDLKKHPNYRYTAEADKKKNAFDLDRLINRRRRPGPDEMCEVYAVAVPDDGPTSEDEDILNYDDIDDPDAFAYEWVWYKSRCTGFLNARRAPLKRTENILVFYQKLPYYDPQFEQGKPYKKISRTGDNSPNYGKFLRSSSGSEDGLRFPGNLLSFSSVQRTVHPTQKPVELCEYLIKTYTRPGEVVADICAGSGTTAVAALNMGRRFVCFETAPAFYAPATERIRLADEAVKAGQKGV